MSTAEVQPGCLFTHPVGPLGAAWRARVAARAGWGFSQGQPGVERLQWVQPAPAFGLAGNVSPAGSWASSSSSGPVSRRVQPTHCVQCGLLAC